VVVEGEKRPHRGQRGTPLSNEKKILAGGQDFHTRGEVECAQAHNPKKEEHCSKEGEQYLLWRASESEGGERDQREGAFRVSSFKEGGNWGKSLH